MLTVLGAGAALLVFAVVIVGLTSPEAVAQLRAALVKNVDEPGRSPYDALASGPASCNADICHFFFPVVPANKRLVVTNVSGLTFRQPGVIALVSSVVTCTNCANNRAFLATPTAPVTVSGADAWTFNQTVNVTYEPGTVPTVKVSFNTDSGFFHNVSVQGYLIDLGL
jgi:hypothetical protein